MMEKMSRNLFYNRSMHHMMRELQIVRSRTLSLYFKDVFVPYIVRAKMDESKRLMGGL